MSHTQRMGAEQIGLSIRTENVEVNLESNMARISLVLIFAVAIHCVAPASLAGEPSTLPGTEPLSWEGDLSARMVAGIDAFLSKETERALRQRSNHWRRDFSSAVAYERSVSTNRERFRRIIGASDTRVPAPQMEAIGPAGQTGPVAETDAFVVHAVRWPVFEFVYGEGLLLRPKQPSQVWVIAIPDADQTPEMLVGLAPGLAPERHLARRLAENGCQVIVPVLLSRQDTWSGNARINRFTNQPHREWIYRQAYELGRHVIGYEVQKVLAAVDWIEAESRSSNSATIGVAGYAEGGLIALYASALDTRIQATLVSGYFDSRQGLWQEPIYRNVFDLLTAFGDAEIASLVAPRSLVVEHSPTPKIDGPPAPRPGRTGAAPGKITALDYESVEREVDRARELLRKGKDKGFGQIELISATEGMATGPCSDRALIALLGKLGVKIEKPKLPGTVPTDLRPAFDPDERQKRQAKELEEHTQRVFWRSEATRDEVFWNQLKAVSRTDWQKATDPFKKALWEQVLGKLPLPPSAAQARSRPLTMPGTNASNRSWTGHEVVLDVLPEVFAWGDLLVPRDIKPGERRPVVVCQHGLEGLPTDVLNEDSAHPPFRYYKGFGSRLADIGFIVFAPHNPYRGQDKFRVLQRKANPLGKSLFSVIIAQHERILDWLASQPFVDPDKIAFYGLSYGGKTAMRVPAVLDRYALSICSGDFNEWVRKNVSVDFPVSYMYTGEYEMPEFDLGNTFNYAEMAALVAPRPFMVERGHRDGVGIDEWVAYEYAKVRRLYDRLEIGDRTAIEFFNGEHTINGVGTFEFLRKQLAP